MVRLHFQVQVSLFSLGETFFSGPVELAFFLVFWQKIGMFLGTFEITDLFLSL